MYLQCPRLRHRRRRQKTDDNVESRPCLVPLIADLSTPQNSRHHRSLDTTALSTPQNSLHHRSLDTTDLATPQTVQSSCLRRLWASQTGNVGEGGHSLGQLAPQHGSRCSRSASSSSSSASSSDRVPSLFCTGSEGGKEEEGEEQKTERVQSVQRKQTE